VSPDLSGKEATAYFGKIFAINAKYDVSRFGGDLSMRELTWPPNESGFHAKILYD
jgi:hypothetical protein